MAEDYGLFPHLETDAVLARADDGGLTQAVPRLLDLLTAGQVSVADGATIASMIGSYPWAVEQRILIEETFAAWWLETLMRSPGEHTEPFTPDAVLGILVGYDPSMIRWFEPWLFELDGPGAAHLATMVLDGLDGPAWVGKDDEASQVLGWARTETVINGIALIGGTHLDDDVLSDVLDRLI